MLAPLAAAMLTAIATLLAFAAPSLYPPTTLAAAPPAYVLAFYLRISYELVQTWTVVASVHLLVPPRVAIYLQIFDELVLGGVEPPYFFRCFSFPLKAKLCDGC